MSKGMDIIIGLALGAVPLLLYSGEHYEKEKEASGTESTPKDSDSSLRQNLSEIPIALYKFLTDNPIFQPDVVDPIIIGVDSGHGRDNDTGAVSGKLKECDITLGTVKYLENFFSQDKNYKTVNTRINDTPGQTTGFIRRETVSDDAGAELLISVHVNAGIETSTGFSCYPLPPSSTRFPRLNHEDSLRFAELLVASVKSLGYPICNPTSAKPGISYCFYYKKDKKDDLKEFAIHETVAAAHHRNNATFGIVEFSKCPAVLCEQGFITNPNDVEIFCTDEGQQILAACYYNAVCEYFGTKPVVDNRGN